jgi:DNA-binding CsgD family transcriptional regulator
MLIALPAERSARAAVPLLLAPAAQQRPLRQDHALPALLAALAGRTDAVMLIRPDRQLVWTNSPMQRLIEQRLVRVTDGRLTGLHGRVSHALSALLSRAAGGGAAVALVAPPPAAGQAVARGLGPMLWRCQVERADDRLGNALAEGPSLLQLTLAQPRLDPARLAPLAELFGLTESEARVLQRLAEGQRPAQIAAELGVALSTVRTHLQSIYGKSAVRSQTQLVRLACEAALR